MGTAPAPARRPVRHHRRYPRRPCPPPRRRQSWATISTPPTRPAIASQGGPRRLVDELEIAWDAWIAGGAVGLYDHGMNVTADDEQFVWAGDPDTGTR
ncbi:hypothetical protein [Embleya sp. NPDC005575]|uniref:hypothetical protein n=1 Tax=Embleya sp. NPDC005575 TaxID=3156892 RepID=UPI0033AE238D